ncbi:MAG: nucleoside hydrolase [bacterium]
MTEAARVARLDPPTGTVRLVIDTDAANEVDDQFAVTYAALSPECAHLEAVYAAPFQRTSAPDADATRPWLAGSPADGMARSLEEIRSLAAALGPSWPDAPIVAGSEAWLTDSAQPPLSPATADLIARARHGDAPLYVVAIGAPTNVASALRQAPDIIEDIVVVWLGGNGSWWSPAAAFNLEQDPVASRVLLDSGVALVHVPCLQVTEKLITTPHEVEERVRGRGPIGDHLADVFAGFDHPSLRTKPLWDLGPVTWVLHSDWCASHLVPSPVLSGGNDEPLTWGHKPDRHLIREIRDIDADAVFADFFDRLPPSAGSEG